MAVTGYTKLGFGPKNYGAADQGAYNTFTNTTAGTGQISGVVTSLADTTPYLLIQNNNPVGGPSIYMDFVKLQVVVAGVGHSLPYMTLQIDRTQNAAGRYTSGGAAGGFTPQNSSGNAPANSSNALIYCGVLVAKAAGSGKILCSHLMKGGHVEIIYDSFTFDFGAPDQQPVNGLVDNGTTQSHGWFGCPPVIIGPQQNFVMNYWGASMSTGTTFLVNGAYWEV